MPTRNVKAHTRCRKISERKVKCYPVSGYPQRHHVPRTTKPTRKYFDLLDEDERTYWLKDEEGRFTGRADSRGETTSTTHVTSGIDFTNNLRGTKVGRIFGRYKSKLGRKLYLKKLKAKRRAREKKGKKMKGKK